MVCHEKNERCSKYIGSYGHNWIILRGTWLFWRRYRACCSCGYIERFYSDETNRLEK